MFVFDLDGVVTDPKDSNRVSADVLARISNELSEGKALAFNTGRSHLWVVDNILPNLTCNPRALAHLLLVAEMGSVVGTFCDGKLEIEKDEDLSLPQSFIEDIRRLLAKPQPKGEAYANFMAWDETKVTMGSLEKTFEASIDDYERVRQNLHPEILALMEKHGLNNFKVHTSIIATDIMHSSTGKHKGGERVLEWLGVRGENPEIIYTFGDSVSDSAMAETFAEAGKETTFVFVGDLKHAYELPEGKHQTVVMKGRYSQDTSVFLDGVE